MSEQVADSIKLEMALHKAVDHQLDAIVQAAVRVAKLLEGGAMRENQLRNVLDTALNTTSLELVANFIRYQIGRSSDWQRNNFGEEVIAALGKGGPVDLAAALAAQEVAGKSDDSALSDVHRRHAHLLLARRFLGELNRAFLYADRTRSWKALTPILEQRTVQPLPAQATEQER